MKKLTLFLLAIVTFLGLSVQVNADVDYSISHYDGVLEYMTIIQLILFRRLRISLIRLIMGKL